MFTIKPAKSLQTSIAIPPDKSISHRAVILSALSRGVTKIKPFLRSDDTIATLECLRALGVQADLKGDLP